MAQLLDKDGNIYNTVVIGEQEWTLENLKTTHYADGTVIPRVPDATDWSNAGLTPDCARYGALYNWFAVDTGKLVPVGWHVPSEAEFQTLITTLGGDAVAGGHLKESGTTSWTAPNTDADNSSGFTGLPSGGRNFVGIFTEIGERCYLWSTNGFGGMFARGLLLYYNTAVGETTLNYALSGLSVRGILDGVNPDDPGTVTDIDGNVYPTVKIGTQVWMAQNLRVTKYNDNTPIPGASVIYTAEEWAAITTDAMCSYDNVPCNPILDAYIEYDTTFSNVATYGNLYNWYAINKGVVSSGTDLAYLTKGGIKQAGWRVPTQADFQKLSTYLGGNTISGGKLKEAGLTHWTTPNTGATNSSGFTALPGGVRTHLGVFDVIGITGSQWTSETGKLVSESNADAILYFNTGFDERFGFSVRLVKDYTPNPEIPIIPQPPYSVGNFPDYRFYISSASSVSLEVFPLNFLATSLVDEKEKDMMFYQRKFNGTLTFGGHSKAIDLECYVHDRCDDWDFFWGVEQSDPCERLYLQIIKVVNGAELPDPYWEGYFSTTEGRFDIDRKLFEVTPLPYDDFTLILEESDTQFDILANTAEVTTLADDGTINVTYTHNHWIIDVITYIASHIAPGTAIVSQFLTNATNPVTLAASKTNLLTIAQKSDIKRPDAPVPAAYPEGTISWNEIMKILWGMFQVSWTYEALTDTIHVEHVSNFPVNPQGEIDIRNQLSCVATNKYSYVKEDMPKYEKFYWMEVQNVNFEGVPIRYESDCLNQDSETNTREIKLDVTTDLEYICNASDDDPNTISDDGWVVLCNESDGGGGYKVAIELGDWNMQTKLNMHLSWAMLHKRYWLHNRVLIEGYINNLITQFYTSQKARQQECSVIFCNPFNPNDVIKTELGELYFDGEKGEVKRAEISPSGEVKLTLRYGTKNYAITPPVEDPPWIQITMTDCTHFEAILSEPAPAGGLTIEFQYVVMSLPGHISVCYNSAPWDVWTIAEGDEIASYDLVLGCAIPDPGCLYVYRVTPVPAEWKVSLVYDENCRC